MTEPGLELDSLTLSLCCSPLWYFSRGLTEERNSRDGSGGKWRHKARNGQWRVCRARENEGLVGVRIIEGELERWEDVIREWTASWHRHFGAGGFVDHIKVYSTILRMGSWDRMKKKTIGRQNWEARVLDELFTLVAKPLRMLTNSDAEKILSS